MFLSDQGWKFINKTLEAFLLEHVIKLLTTNACTPEENCLVEKLNGTLMNKVLAILEMAQLPFRLWGEPLGYVLEVDNMNATKALNGIISFEKIWGMKPVVRDRHVLVISQTKAGNKLEMRAGPGYF
ncbi:Rve domain containing hypothetical protein [Phytophthora palmivora]|uniref:Integrase catalytic domain-containing protein n=1 Tax=Phytophthora palmivora TaxID=4796 RepID=A0A2P4YL59_9STRA|nr:Rve domain containing hypothetical protein [Phytophthora palmivora]